MRILADKRAFSLVELLVAVAVAAVVGGAVLALIMQSFGVWEDGVRRASELRAADDFDLDFARDFSSACPGLGFKGDRTSCVFWTLHLAPEGGPTLSRVRYAFDTDGILAESWRQGDDLQAGGLTTRYGTRDFAEFSYAGTNVADDAWQTDWDCPTGMPTAVSVRCPEPPGRRFYIRRTLE